MGETFEILTICFDFYDIWTMCDVAFYDICSRSRKFCIIFLTKCLCFLLNVPLTAMLFSYLSTFICKLMILCVWNTLNIQVMLELKLFNNSALYQTLFINSRSDILDRNNLWEVDCKLCLGKYLNFFNIFEEFFQKIIKLLNIIKQKFI